MVPVKYVKNLFAAIYGSTEENFHLTRELGISWILKDAHWSKLEKKEGEHDFSSYDWVVNNCKKHNVKPLPKLNSIPEWGTTAPEGVFRRTHFAPEGNLIKKYRQHVQKVLDHYPDIDYFEIWNEPNLDVFQRTGTRNKKHIHYVDKILKPAAEVIHNDGRKVVGPSFSVEWPYSNEIQGHSYNVQDNIKSLEKWLNYNQAWQDIDILSLHYIKGDTEKLEMENAMNMLPFLDYIHKNWIKPGKLEGIWVTEEGLTAIEVNPDLGFFSLEPWEWPPYPQWIPRYIVPFIDWSLKHDWDYQDKYKLFWFNCKSRNCTLAPTMLLEETKKGIQLSPIGQAYKTLIKNMTAANEVGYFQGVKVGFGLDATEDYPYIFKSYAFTLDQDIFVVAWLDLPGIADIRPEGNLIEATLEQLGKKTIKEIQLINYVNGDQKEIDDFRWNDNTLKIQIPRIADPVLYFKIKR